MAARDEHDLREVLPADLDCNAVVADFSPTNDEPDPDIYPLSTDRGRGEWSGDYGDLIPIFNTFPEPNVRFITPGEFAREFGYDYEEGPRTREFDRSHYHRREYSVRMTPTITEAFRRLARLWNGEFVGPNRVHLLRDKCPTWNDLFEGLDSAELETLTPTIDPQRQLLVEAFGDYNWFTLTPYTDSHLAPQYVLRRKVKWAPTQSAKTLMIKHGDIPTPRGDRMELLTHRVGVGTVAAYLQFELAAETIETYPTHGSFKPDAAGRLPDGSANVYEVITGHNNNALNLETFEKIQWVASQDKMHPYVVFDKRDTAVRVLRYWRRHTDAELSISLDSAPPLEWLDAKLGDAYADPETNWPIAGATTITRLWEHTFGDNAPRRTDNQLVSLIW